jgi:FAD/FMN-containing dehydrogenase
MKQPRREALRLLLAGAGSVLFGGGAGHAAAPTEAPAAGGWDALRAAIDGQVILRGEGEYETRRNAALWNARVPALQPDALVRVASVADVRETMRHAHARGLKVAVRGGGHSWWGAPLRQGGILLDLAALSQIRVDAPSRTALVGPAARGREVSAALAAEGLAFPVGHCPTVAMGGYLLAGGLGWNGGAWGPACASVRGIQVVTANGKLLLADAQQNQDLLWAARGAGPGFFGAVTRFDLRLHPLPRSIRTSTFVYSLGDLDRVAAWLPECARALRPEVEMACILGGSPAGGADKVLVVMATAFADTEEDATRWLAPLESGPVASAIAATRGAATPMDVLRSMMDAAFPAGLRYGADVCWTNAPPADFLARVRAIAAAAPSPRSFFLIGLETQPREGAKPPDMALSRSGGAFLGIYGIWDDAAKDAENAAWVARMAAALEPINVGHYVGEADLTAAPDRASLCFSPEAWAKLSRLRQRHDPAGIFHAFPGKTT